MKKCGQKMAKILPLRTLIVRGLLAEVPKKYPRKKPGSLFYRRTTLDMLILKTPDPRRLHGYTKLA